MSWYSAGTVAVTNGSATINGTGTSWVRNVREGDAFKGPDKVFYEVSEIVSDTQITLATVYDGATVSGASYTITPTTSHDKELVEKITTLLGEVDKQSHTYATIADFNAAIGSTTFTVGDVANVEGIEFRYTGASSAIPGKPGWVPNSRPVRMEHFGAVGDGVTNDQAAYDAALSFGQAVYLPKGKSYLVTNASNTLGVPFSGKGRIITAITGGYVQQNSAADTSPVAFRSHLFVVKKKWISGLNAKIQIFGDSTATSSYGLDIPGFVSDTLRRMGAGVESVTNSAVAGDAWFSKDLSALMTAQQDLAIIKFGINDVAPPPNTLESSLSAFRNAMRQRLGEIRASTFGGYDNLSILLIGPNALGNNSLNANNRNNLWLEMIRGVYLEAAKDFQCCYYDPYIEARNAQGGEDRWLDAYLVHPQVNYNLDVWGRALEATCKPYGSVVRNGFVLRTFAEGVAPASTTGIGSYPRGLSVLRCEAGDGWPWSGIVTTIWHPDNTGYQVIANYANGYPQVRTRTYLTGSSTWTPWSGEGVALSLQNGWIAYGGSLEAPIARRAADGLIVLSGVMKNGTTTGGTLLFTLPAGYRPATERYVVGTSYVASQPDTVLLRIQTNGQVTAIRNAQSGFLGLDGVQFYAGA